MTQKRFLIGSKEIRAYVGVDSWTLFKDLLLQGLPARIFNGRWYAHTENIDDFLRGWTRFRNKTVADETEPETDAQ
jgi:hypothetical protein